MSIAEEESFVNLVACVVKSVDVPNKLKMGTVPVLEGRSPFFL